MKKMKFSKGNIIAIAMAAVLAVGGVGAYKANAATNINMDTPATITAKIEVNNLSSSYFVNDYKGAVEIKLYKIADYNQNGTFEKVDAFSAVDITVMDKPNVTVAAIQENIVAPAKTIVDGANAPEATATITIEAAGEKVATSDALDKGLYLYVPQPCQNDRFNFTFTPYIIATPTSQYIMTGDGSDEWIYNPSFVLKAQEEQRYGDIKISKTLSRYNQSLGDAVCVFEVKAVLEDATVFDNVYAIDLQSASEGKVIEVKNLPATAVVTVTEVYSGASYDNKNESAVATTTVIADAAGENIPVVTFTNDYNDKLIVGGNAIINEFKYDQGNFFFGNQQQTNFAPTEATGDDVVDEQDAVNDQAGGNN